MATQNEEYDGVDALMAAITGQELSDEARADSVFMAGHREAEADLALMREQLEIIGLALADDERPRRESTLVRAPRNRSRLRGFAFGTLAVAAVAAVLAGMGWLLAAAGGSASSTADGASSEKAAGSSAGSVFSSPGYLACARLVAEGVVTTLERVPGGAGQERVTLRVTRSYKPASTKKEVTLLIEKDTEALDKGDHILVAVLGHSAVPDHVLRGEKAVARERPGLLRALPESADVACE